jgi:hypothetical protein
MRLADSHLATVTEQNDAVALRKLIAVRPDLLQKRAATDTRIPPPILYAAELGHDKVLELLLDHEAYLTKHPLPAITREYNFGNLNRVDEIWDRMHEYNFEEEQESWAVPRGPCRPLTAACFHARLSTVGLLLDRTPQPDINQVDGGSRTPLLATLVGRSYGNIKEAQDRRAIVRLLLDRGANVQYTARLRSIATISPPSISVMNAAALCKDIQVLRWLVEAGADVHSEATHFNVRVPLWPSVVQGDVSLTCKDFSRLVLETTSARPTSMACCLYIWLSWGNVKVRPT